MDDGNKDSIPSGGCHMCLAIPGKIVELLPENEIQKLAVIDVAGVRRRVDLGLLEDDPPVVGDWVLIHVGFAMSKISEQEAIEQMNILAILGEAEAAMQEVRGYGLPEDLPEISPGASATLPAQTAKPS
jgi:hydrogenase expression/formation protein HypC